MGKKGIIILTIGLIVAISLMYFFYEPTQRKPEKIIPASWQNHYKHTSKDPYGTYLFYELLKATTFKFKQVEDSPIDLIQEYQKYPDDMLLVAYNRTYPDYLILWTEIDSFLLAGNNALFILEEDPYSLENYYREIFTVKTHRDSLMKFHFTSDRSTDYEFEFLNDFKRKMHDWNYFKVKDQWSAYAMPDAAVPGTSYILDGDSVFNYIVHEVNEYQEPVFIEIPYGAGSLFIHRNPMAFTNISLLEEKNVEHMETMMNKIQYKGIIYNTPPIFKMPPSNDGKERTSPLQFILSNPSLTWAYYIIIGSLLLFVVFNLKRKQKAIPVLPPKTNSTLEFVDALSKIYFQKHNNQNIVKHKYRIFITFIRTHYHVNWIKDRTELSRLISVKSGLELNVVITLMDKLEQLSKQKVNDEQLIELHKMIDNFYKNCK